MNARAPESRTIAEQQKQETSAATFLDRILERSEGGVDIQQGKVDYVNFPGLLALAEVILRSGIHPESLDSISKIAIVIARGRSVGLDPFQSMDSFYLVNGRATLFGQMPLALCRQHPLWEESGFDQYWEVKGLRQEAHPDKFEDESITAVAVTLRKGAKKPMIRRFSVADAKRAGLWSNPKRQYGNYPERMLPARALSHNLADNFGDALKGIAIREVMDEDTQVHQERTGTAEETNSRSQQGNVENGGNVNQAHSRPSIEDLRDKIQAKKKRTQTTPEVEQKEAQKVIPEYLESESEINVLRTAIMDALLFSGDDEEHMNLRLKEASKFEDPYQVSKWMELDTLKNCEDVAWMKAVLERLRS